MKICVCGGGEQPRVFYLGGRRLPVVAVLGAWADGGARCYEVSVEDGRRFVLRHDSATGRWELTAVYSATSHGSAASAPLRSPKSTNRYSVS
ncbi:MAG TPA: hypothetical protein VGI18_07305 [Burkholderiales bacterium]|jgi:hypothetical protein